MQLDRCPGCSEQGSASQHSSCTHTWTWEQPELQVLQGKSSLLSRWAPGSANIHSPHLAPTPSPQPGWGSPAGPAEPSCLSRGAPHVRGKALGAASQGLLPARRPREHGKGLLAGISCSLCDPQALPGRHLLTRDSPGCITPLLTLSPLLSPPSPSQTPRCSLPPPHKTSTSLIPREFPLFSLSLSLSQGC